MATEFTVEEAQERLAELLDRAETGEEIVITRFGVPSVRLQPVRNRRLSTASSSGAATGMAGGVIGAVWIGPADDGADHSSHHGHSGHHGHGDYSDPGVPDTFDVGTDFWSPDSGVQ